MIANILDIILVEDNPCDIEITLDALQEYNIANRVKVLSDGEQAVNYIFRQGEFSDCGICEHPVLVLLDLNLPKINGIEILRKIRSNERTKLIPVVVLTSSRLDKDKIESYNLGVNAYIVKPVEFDNFAKVIAHIGFFWAVLNQPPGGGSKPVLA
jgi:CheY-like chemotaxis protein